MKVGKVEHIRCSDIVATTYVWVPDDMTPQAFKQAVERARKAYQQFVNEWEKIATMESPGYNPQYQKYPDKTVAEIDADFKQRKAEYDAFEAHRQRAWKSFGDYLRDDGMIPFWDHDPDHEVMVDWGHQHGKSFNFSGTKMHDLPGPAVDPDAEEE